MPPTFHVENFGCRAARADGEAIASLLRSSGSTESQPGQADVVIVNTCSVTAEADREARAYIRRAHRLNPAARIVATGCYAQRSPGELAGLPGVAAVIGNSHKALAPEIALHYAHSAANVPGKKSNRDDRKAFLSLQDLGQNEPPPLVSGHDFSRADRPAYATMPLAPENDSQIVSIATLLAAAGNQALILADDSFAHSFLEEAPIVPGVQTRPNLKIQEGCSNRCSFCVIPQTRGNSRSLAAESVLSHVRNFIQAGGNELVLSGINLGRWGRDLNAQQPRLRTLAALVRTVLEQTSLRRLRLSSIEPMDWDADLIALLRDFRGRMVRHAHLPLQSGSDSVLRRMHRRYRPWHYAEKVAELLRAAGSALTLGADVMVGFPGETDREFQESRDFIRSLPFGYLHLFPFSPRPGTRAWALHAENPVSTAVRDERMAELRQLASEKTGLHRAQFAGAELEAVTLHTPSAAAAAGRTVALTDNFLPVDLEASLQANQVVQIQVTGLAADGTLLASVISRLDSGLCRGGITPRKRALNQAFAIG